MKRLVAGCEKGFVAEILEILGMRCPIQPVDWGNSFELWEKEFPAKLVALLDIKSWLLRESASHYL